MDRVTENLSKGAIEERIAQVVRTHGAADRRIRHLQALQNSFWLMVTCTFVAVAAMLISALLRG
jgi:dihydrodipicolinate reductase